MSYTKDLTIPKSTTAADPTTVDIPIQSMLIDRMEITFPDGCVGLVGVRFRYQSRIIFPYNPEGWYKGNNQTVIFSPNIELKEDPFVLSIEGYNNDDTYQHIVYIVIDVEFKGGFLDFWRSALGLGG